MSLGDAKRPLLRHEGDPQRGWITPERLMQAIEQIYADVDMLPKHRSGTAYPPGAVVWWGSPPRIYTAPRTGVPAGTARPGEPNSIWLDGTAGILKHAVDLGEVEATAWFVVEHPLHTRDVYVQVRRSDGTVLTAQPVMRVMDEDTIAFLFDHAYQAGELRVVIIG